MLWYINRSHHKFKRNKNFAPAEPIIRRKTWNKMKQQLETLKSNNKKLFELTEAKDAEIKAKDAEIKAKDAEIKTKTNQVREKCEIYDRIKWQKKPEPNFMDGSMPYSMGH